MNWIIPQTVDMAKIPTRDVTVTGLYGLVYQGDANAHQWQVTVMDGGEPADLSAGTVAAYFLRPDKSTVVIEGTVSENVCTFTLTQEVYAKPGMVAGGVRYAVSGSATITLANKLFEVAPNYDSGTYIDPGQEIPSIADLLDAIEDMEEATAAAEAAATKSVRYDSAQSLTSTQKAQAIANLGLTAVDDGEGNITFT